MTQCAELLPDPPDRIDALAVHSFLEIIESFPVWFNESIYRQELLHGKNYFMVETAKDLMMQARTPRGFSTRQYFVGVAKKEEE
jgi:phage anti-repressor protein